jgi:hypothetical protein
VISGAGWSEHMGVLLGTGRCDIAKTPTLSKRFTVVVAILIEHLSNVHASFRFRFAAVSKISSSFHFHSSLHHDEEFNKKTSKNSSFCFSFNYSSSINLETTKKEREPQYL